jgi:MFS family permease
MAGDGHPPARYFPRMTRRDHTLLFVNIGHLVDHLFMLIFPTAVLAMGATFDLPWNDLLPLALGGFIAFGACSLPAGWLGDRWSRRGMMIVFFVGIGLATALTGFAQTTTQLAICLTLIGVFAAIYHPVGLAMIVAEPERIGRALGVNGVWGNLGLGFAALSAGAITTAFGWRAAFIVPGLLSVALGLAFAVLVPEEPPAKKRAGAALQLPRGVMVRIFVVLLIATSLSGMIFTGMTIAMPKIFDERLAAVTGSTLGIGALVCLVYVIAAMAQLIVGPLIDRYPLRNVFVPVTILQAPLLLLATSLDGWAMVLISTALMFAVFGQIPVNDAIVARHTDAAWRSRVYAVRYVISFGASSCAVPLVAFLHGGGGFERVFLVMSVLGGLVAIAALLFPDLRRERAPVAASPVVRPG